MLHKLVPEKPAILMRYYPFVPPRIADGEDEHVVILRNIAAFLLRLSDDLNKIKEDRLPEELRYQTMDGFLGPMSGWLSTRLELQTAYCTLRGMLDGDAVEGESNEA